MQTGCLLCEIALRQNPKVIASADCGVHSSLSEAACERSEDLLDTQASAMAKVKARGFAYRLKFNVCTDG